MKQMGKRPTRPHPTTGKPKAPLMLALSFGAGTAAASLLLCLFATLLWKFPVPLTFVQPMACAAAGVGAMVSGLVLAQSTERQRLLCGLGCGAFYAACLLAASALCGGEIVSDASGAMVPAALVLGGLLGGALSAVRGA